MMNVYAQLATGTFFACPRMVCLFVIHSLNKDAWRASSALCIFLVSRDTTVSEIIISSKRSIIDNLSN